MVTLQVTSDRRPRSACRGDHRDAAITVMSGAKPVVAARTAPISLAKPTLASQLGPVNLGQ